MKTLISLLAFLVLLFGQIFAQKGVYLKPFIETTAAITYTYETKPYNNTPYFKYETQKIVWPHRLSPLTLGILVGYTFNNTISIETGIAQSGNASGFRLSYNSIVNDSLTFASGQQGGSAGTAGIKIPLLVTLPLFKFDSVRLYNSKPFGWGMRLKFGINFYKQPKGDVFLNMAGFGTDSIIIAPHTRLDVDGGLHTLNDKSILYQLGLETEFNFKRLKGLCLNLYYLYGRKDLSVINLHVTVNQQINYVFNTYGRGSGFCLQLSKKIAMKPKKQKQQKGVDYYKN
jgi:hypothetical protein